MNVNKILLKAKRKDNREWTQGFYYQCTSLNHYIIDPKKGRSIIEPSTICQYTWLTESYERTKEFEPLGIWQHDILEIDYEGKKIICFVDWAICGFTLVSNDFEDGFIWVTDVIESEPDEYQYIAYSRKLGNIHDNPELISKQE